MKVKKIILMYFSPGGNVEKLGKAMAIAASEELKVSLDIVDFTLPEVRNKAYSFERDDLLIIGTPVYAGRVPNKILPFVRECIKGCNTLSIPYVAYGNRSYGDALSELVYEQRNNGFVPVGACAYTSEHSFATILASGRPNEDDLLEADGFVRKLCGKIQDIYDVSEIPCFEVKGNTPPGPYYKPLRADGKAAVFLKAKPKTDPAKCNDCGICAKACPMGSISLSDFKEVSGVCIKCNACVSKCPQKAKYFDDPDYLSHKEMLEQNYRDTKENSYFTFLA